MLKIFWFLVLIVHNVHSQIGFTSIPCSQRNPKIVGGLEAERHEIPHAVSLTRRGGHFCGAIIIHEKWLLTAGHCICNGLNKFMKPSQIKGVLGLHSISQYLNGIDNDRNGDGPIQVNFKKFVPHPNYKCTHPKNDIALLELEQPVQFTRRIQPCCLSSSGSLRNHENEIATVSGWGWTLENQALGDPADIIRKAAVRVWNNKACEQSYQLYGRASTVITDSQMCAGYENGVIDSCWADSGGPLMSKENFLIGVVSTGIGCARPGLPGIYTRVSKYIDWMESVIFSRS